MKRSAYLFVASLILFTTLLILNHGRAEPTWRTSVDLPDVWDTKIFSAESTIDGKDYEAEVYGRDFDKTPKCQEGATFPLNPDQVRTHALEAFYKYFPALQNFHLGAIHVIYLKIIGRQVCQIEFDGTARDGSLSKLSFLMLPTGKLVIP